MCGCGCLCPRTCKGEGGWEQGRRCWMAAKCKAEENICTCAAPGPVEPARWPPRLMEPLRNNAAVHPATHGHLWRETERERERARERERERERDRETRQKETERERKRERVHCLLAFL